MSDFHVTVYCVDKVYTHPDPELSHLSVVKVLDHTLIAGKLEDGSFRYNQGDLVVFIPVNSVIPLDLLKFQGFYWDVEKDRGLLKGSKRNRVASVTRGSVTSDGIMFPLEEVPVDIEFPAEDKTITGGQALGIRNSRGEIKIVLEGNQIETFLGITEYKP